MALTPEEVRKVALLSRLALPRVRRVPEPAVREPPNQTPSQAPGPKDNTCNNCDCRAFSSAMLHSGFRSYKTCRLRLPRHAPAEGDGQYSEDSNQAHGDAHQREDQSAARAGG